MLKVHLMYSKNEKKFILTGQIKRNREYNVSPLSDLENQDDFKAA